MAALPAPSRSSDSPLGTLLLVVLVVLLALQLAWWTWRFAAPPEVASRAAAAPSDVDLDLVARLFGAHHDTAASANALRLKGVVAPTPGTTAAAIFAGPSGKDIAVLPGGEAASGVKLAEVYPDHVIVTRAGVQERIDLESPRTAKSATASSAATRGFHLDVARNGQNDFSFARRDLDQALRDPGQLNYLGQIGMPPGGGVRLDAAPPGSLASKLGLQPGDVIRKVNGQAIGSSGDLARLYQQFATLDTIQAEVERAGQVVRLSYRIQ